MNPEVLALLMKLVEHSRMKARHRAEDEGFRVGKAVDPARTAEWEVVFTNQILAEIKIEDEIETEAERLLAEAVA